MRNWSKHLRRPSLPEALVLVLLLWVMGRVIYHVVHWRSAVEAIKTATLPEIVLALGLGIAYYLIACRTAK